MVIWKSKMTLEKITQVRVGTMTEHLGIKFIEIGDDFLKGAMPVDARTKQPFGIMHGGASCVLAETLGSVAACFCVDIERELCVGLSLNINHISMVTEGWVYGIACPVHIGGRTQVWNVTIEDKKGKLVSSTCLTLAVLERKKITVLLERECSLGCCQMCKGVRFVQNRYQRLQVVGLNGQSVFLSQLDLFL